MPRRFEISTSDYFQEEDDWSDVEQNYDEDYGSEDEYRPNMMRRRRTQVTQPTGWHTEDFSRLTSLTKTPEEEALSNEPVVPQEPKKTWAVLEKQPLAPSLSQIQAEEEKRKREPAPVRLPPSSQHNAVNRRLISHPNQLPPKPRNMSENRPELLCIYGRHHECRMSHSLQVWKPKTCRFHNCRNGARCIFWHNNRESVAEFLARSIKNENSFMYKNRELYRRHYLTRNS